VLENLTDTLVGLGRALEVLESADLLANFLTLANELASGARIFTGCLSPMYLLGRDGLLASLAQLLDGLLVVAEILLAADKDDRQALAEVQDLRDPLSCHSCQHVQRTHPGEPSPHAARLGCYAVAG
jgi:hypothetical protein